MVKTRRLHLHAIATSLLVLCSLCHPVVKAYRGTVPIFPDAHRERRKPLKDTDDLGRRREKVFSPKAVIEVDGLTKVFKKNDAFYRVHDDVRDLRGVSVKLEGPGAVAVIGGPTSGKDTFLQCLAGLKRPDAGTIKVGGLRRVVYIRRGVQSKTGKCVRELLRKKVASRLPGNNPGQVEVVTDHIMKHADLCRVGETVDKDLSGSEVYRFALGMGLARACSSPTPPIFILAGFFNRSVSSIRHSVELTLDALQRELGVMVIFSATNHQVVMELGRQVVDFMRGRITRVTTHEKCRYAQEVFKRMATRSRPWDLQDYALRVVRGEDPTTGEVES